MAKGHMPKREKKRKKKKDEKLPQIASTPAYVTQEVEVVRKKRKKNEESW